MKGNTGKNTECFSGKMKIVEHVSENSVCLFVDQIYKILSVGGAVHLSYAGLFEMIVGVLTTCHTQYT